MEADPVLSSCYHHGARVVVVRHMRKIKEASQSSGVTQKMEQTAICLGQVLSGPDLGRGLGLTCDKIQPRVSVGCRHVSHVRL